MILPSTNRCRMIRNNIRCSTKEPRNMIPLMVCRFSLLLALWALQGCTEAKVCVPGQKTEPPARTVYWFGKDQMVFPEKFALPTKEEQQRLALRWHEPAVKPWLREVKCELPFRDGVQFSRVYPSDILAREKGRGAFVKWDNIGHFLAEIKSVEQCRAVLALLHDPWFSEGRLTADQLRRATRKVKTDTGGLPLKVLREDFDDDLITKGCFQKDGYWLVDFALIEGASIVEYKYAIDGNHRIARIRRVLVEGPPHPIPLGSPPILPKEVQVLEKRWVRCLQFLMEAAGLRKK